MATINIIGTGGIIEGNLGAADVNVNLDSALYLDGTGDYITVPSDSSLDFGAGVDFSFSMWVKFPSTLASEELHLISRGQAGNATAFTLRHNQTNLFFKFSSGSNSGNYALAPILGTWAHIAMTFDRSANAVLYVNGVAQITQDISSKTGNAISLAQWLIGGENSASPANLWRGHIADVKLFADLLTETEVKQLASKINCDSTTFGIDNRRLWYKINEGTGTSIVDHDDSGTDYNATLSNGNWVFDQYYADVYDNSTTTDGTFTVTQGKAEGKALSTLSLDGTGDFVKVNDFDLYNSATEGSFSCWVRPDGVSGSKYIATKYDTSAGDREFQLYINSANVIWNVQHDKNNYDSNHSVTGSTTLVADRWYHLCGTFSTTNGQKIYVDGVLDGTANTAITDALDDSTSALMFGANQSSSPTNEFDGSIRDIKSFAHELSADQVASLHSGTYNVTPEHWWKMDEGTGSTANDTGTGTAANSSSFHGNAALGDENGTLDLDGTLTVSANGTLSAPRGNLDVGGNMASSGALTHNNGKVRFTEHLQVTGTSLTFYNMSWDGSNTKTIDLMNDTTIENELDGNNQWRLKASSNTVTLTMGTATSQGTIDTTGMSSYGLEWDSNTSNFVKIKGVNSLFPAIITGTNIDWDDVSSGLVRLENCDFQGDITTGGGGVTITLTGDCEFDAVTVSSGDKLDLNGQRATFSGNLSNQSSSPNGIDYDGMLYFTGSGRMDSDGYSTNLDKLTLVQQGTSTSDADLAGDNLIKTFLYNQPSVTQKNHRGAIQTIVGAGTWTCGSGESPDFTNLTVATGGTLEGSSSTLTCAGDFTTSGGLIGKSAMVVSGDNDYEGMVVTELQAQSDWNFSGSEGLTIEGWFKFDDLDFGTGNDAILAGHVRSGDTTGKRYGCGLQIMDDKVMAIAANNDTAHTHFDNCSFPVTDMTAGKWHHLAMTVDANDSSTPLTKLYLDGKLKAQVTGVTTVYFGYNFVVGGYADNHDSQGWTNRRMDGCIARASCFRQEMTAAQLRSMMFTDYTAMAALSSGVDEAKTVGWWQFDEGTGAAVDNKGTAGDYGNADGVIASVGTTWAGGGTYTRDTSTLVMSKSGTQTITSLSGTFFENLTVADGSTTQLHTLGQTGGNLNIAGNFIIHEKIKPHASTPNTFLGFYVGDKTITITEPTTGVVEIVKLAFNHTSGTLTLPYCYLQTLDCAGNGGTTVQSSTLRSTVELQVKNGHTYNSSAATLEFKTIDLQNGSTVDLSGSLIEQKPDSADGAIAFGASATVTMTNKSGRGVAILGKEVGGEKCDVNMPADGDWFIEGGGQGGKHAMEDCNMLSGSDVTVLGTTLGLVFADNTANVHQFTQNIDTEHMLDITTTDDKDIKLPRPTLDNSLQLSGGD